MKWYLWVIVWALAGPAILFAWHVAKATAANFHQRRARKRAVDAVGQWGTRRNSDVGGVVHRKGK